jgi:uncharacterized alkaline shock family protein YloU
MSAVLSPQSERFELAVLARAAVLGVPGVLGTTSGPTGLISTVDGRARVEGVLCTAVRDGGYDLTLSLVCDLRPLHALAERVKTHVRGAVTRSGLQVQRIDVHVADVVSPLPEV